MTKSQGSGVFEVLARCSLRVMTPAISYKSKKEKHNSTKFGDFPENIYEHIEFKSFKIDFFYQPDLETGKSAAVVITTSQKYAQQCPLPRL